MTMTKIFAAIGIAVAAAGMSVPAHADRWDNDRRGNHDSRWDDRRGHHDARWDRDRRWKNERRHHRVRCWTEWHHHHKVRVCR